MNWAQTVMLVLTKMKIREKTWDLRQNLRLVTRKEQEQSYQAKKLGRFRKRPIRKVRWGSFRTWEQNYWRKRNQPGIS